MCVFTPHRLFVIGNFNEPATTQTSFSKSCCPAMRSEYDGASFMAYEDWVKIFDHVDLCPLGTAPVVEDDEGELEEGDLDYSMLWAVAEACLVDWALQKPHRVIEPKKGDEKKLLTFITNKKLVRQMGVSKKNGGFFPKKITLEVLMIFRIRRSPMGFGNGKPISLGTTQIDRKKFITLGIHPGRCNIQRIQPRRVFGSRLVLV